MLTRNGTKIIGLAESIVDNGFLDLETPCVYPSEIKGQYIVAEGNRRIIFIAEILEDVHNIAPSKTTGGTGSGATGGKPGGGSSGGGKGGSGKGKGGKPAPTTRTRKGLIEKRFSPVNLDPQKIIDIVDELKSLSVGDYENCSGVMFRVFFELSISHYMKTHKIPRAITIKVAKPVTHHTKELSLKDKTQEVIKHLEKNPKIESKSLKAIRDLLHNSHPLSAESLNAYVHSPTHIAMSADGQKKGWSNLQHIFDYLWEK